MHYFEQGGDNGCRTKAKTQPKTVGKSAKNCAFNLTILRSFIPLCPQKRRRAFSEFTL